ncbi:MAG: hypothetical protein UU37_C0002G0060 [Candidatus Gottesmanbacteria bacterium GW2011_GWA2_41_12]|uniref:Uncharacterized protein n=2 Tax=Candidatus Gottesmaniibacteriota TaxID=1752720 RepID=A0A0G0WVU5_9BACT|nr:MAG: hypothetical protein UT63_C0072G0006 [Candidatus Gottesmanbacteria bacterium GW2011_GWC2_39_8]KKR88545.1 MAG: hypothetical protein UU37_C0002G0060 [Candidatus Gottesmanbacteria bacterium GW2011_GWA2_41_12]
MGSFIETNDTLQITREQGFPAELDLERHKVTPFKFKDFTGKVFEFKNKPAIRVYQQPPVRVFFVENVNSKWIYWGLCQILEITHDYLNKTTSGKYKITYINTIEEMKQMHNLSDRRPDTKYFE